MTKRDISQFIVTTDEELSAKLWAKWRAKPEDGGLDSLGMAEYAYSLGLYPPGYQAREYHTIHQHTPYDGSGATYLVWDTAMDRPDPTYLDQAREEADEDDDEFDDGEVWGELFPELRTNKRDRE